ncbi:MAG: damage-inducible protein CinA [Burkholderiales bacterium]|jgi:nicotinamide-nucleotide amidase|nr:damage-inducible protein CinA [Burkholderiales bacterium]
MFSDKLINLADEVLACLKSKGLILATAESCTGGLIASLITSIPGSSEIFDRGFVTYSNQAKIDILKVPSALIGAKGAVSEEVAAAMAEGVLNNTHVDISISVTGIAGPGGGSEEKPVGLVYIGLGVRNNKIIVEKNIFQGSRDEIRLAAVERAVILLLAKYK